MMTMPTVNQFDGAAALFAGNNFMPSQSIRAPVPQLLLPNHGPQSLLPLTVKQISESYFSSGDKSTLVVDGVEANGFGVVVDKVGRVTDVSFLLNDGTGRIEIGGWNGKFVEVHGHLKEFQGKKHAFAFSISSRSKFFVVEFESPGMKLFDG